MLTIKVFSNPKERHPGINVLPTIVKLTTLYLLEKISYILQVYLSSRKWFTVNRSTNL